MARQETVEEIIIRLQADMSQVNTRLAKFDKRVDQTHRSASRSMTKLAGVMRTAISGVFIFQIIRAGLSLNSFVSQIEEMQGKSSVVFGEFADSARKDLAEFGNEIGRSRFELEGMAASIQDTFVPLGFARGEAAKLSVQLTKLAVDAGSFNNVNAAEVMRDFQSAIVGNHEAVRKYGIIITEATIQQELYRQGIKKSSLQASTLEKVEARRAIIASGTADAHGDAARTAHTYANQMERLKGEFGEFLAALKGETIDEAAGKIGFLADTLDRMEKALTRINETARLERGSGFLGGFPQLDLENYDHVIGRIKTIDRALDEAYANKDSPFFAAWMEGAGDGLGKLREEARILEAIRTQMAAAQFNPETGTDTKEVPQTREQIAAEKKRETQLVKLRNEYALLDEELHDATPAALRYMAISQKLAGVTAEEAEEIRNLVYAIEATEQALKVEAKIADLAAANSDLRMETEGATAAELEFIKMQRSLGTMSAEQATNLRNLIAEKHNMAEATEDLARKQDILKGAFESLGDGIADTLTDSLLDGKLALDDFKNLFKRFVGDLISEALRVYVIRSILGYAVGYAAPVAAAPANQNYGTPATYGVRARSSGGPVYPGQSYLVGEDGPEIYTAPSAGKILNAGQTRSAMGGGSVNIQQHFSITGDVTQQAQVAVLELMPMVMAQTKQAIADDARRGGIFANDVGR